MASGFNGLGGSSMSLVGGRRPGVNYPSPYFDIASTYVPPSMKEFFKWTRFFYYSHSVIHPIIDKISEYPITGLIYHGDGDDKELSAKSKKNWEKLLEGTLKLRSFLVEMLLDYNVYGNCLVSIMYPFKRYLKCPKCEDQVSIERATYKWRDYKFFSKCNVCKHQGAFKVSDAQIKNRSMCRLIRWNPFNVTIKHNSITDERQYWYRMSNKDIKAIQTGDRSWIERTPWEVIDAVRRNKQIKLDDKNLYHMKRPSIADNDMTWGMPVILPVIKDAYWLQVLRKANEAISLEHIVPWRILFPASNADVTPYVTENLGDWRSNVQREIRRWRQDPNHISVMPLPLGTQNFGGDGKLLQVWQEEKVLQTQIAGGLGVPLEMVTGGLSWSGSSVSLRILENHFIRDREEIQNFLNMFLIPNLQRYFRLTKVRITQKNFKMADDVQQKQLIMQLMQMGKVSDTTFLEENDLDFQEEAEKRMAEQNITIQYQRRQMLQQAQLQGAVQVVGAKYQAMAQQASMSMQPQPSPQQMMQPQDQRLMSAQAPTPEQQMQMTEQQPQQQQAQPQGQQPPQQPPEQPMPMAQGGLVVPSNGNGNGHLASQGNAAMADAMIGTLLRMDEDSRKILLEGFEQQQPTLVKMIRKKLSASQKATIDMRPLPEQKPPRRKGGPI